MIITNRLPVPPAFPTEERIYFTRMFNLSAQMGDYPIITSLDAGATATIVTPDTFTKFVQVQAGGKVLGPEVEIAIPNSTTVSVKNLTGAPLLNVQIVVII